MVKVYINSDLNALASLCPPNIQEIAKRKYWSLWHAVLKIHPPLFTAYLLRAQSKREKDALGFKQISLSCFAACVKVANTLII